MGERRAQRRAPTDETAETLTTNDLLTGAAFVSDTGLLTGVADPSALDVVAANADRSSQSYGGAAAGEMTVQFRFPDPRYTLAGVRLWQEVRIPGDQLDFARTDEGWELVLPKPAVQRMEYMLELRHPDGGVETILDPHNPLRVRGVFGDHSVLEMPGYARPAWLSLDPVDGVRTPFSAPGLGGLRRAVEGELWSPVDAEPGEQLPLLVAHDGPEFDDLAMLGHYFGAQIAAGVIPRARLALLSPGDRNARYAASPGYARTLVRSVLPTVAADAPILGRPVIMGASLGALAALHAEWEHPGTFGGLFLQSGSFFRPRTDGQDRTFGRYWRIVDAVSAMLDAPAAAREPLVVSMTCGRLEHNVENNRLMASRLVAQGHDTRFTEAPDMHTYTAWRDAFDPYLTDLLKRCLPGE